MTKNQFWKGSTFFVLFSFDLTLIQLILHRNRTSGSRKQRMGQRRTISLMKRWFCNSESKTILLQQEDARLGESVPTTATSGTDEMVWDCLTKQKIMLLQGWESAGGNAWTWPCPGVLIFAFLTISMNWRIFPDKQWEWWKEGGERRGQRVFPKRGWN